MRIQIISDVHAEFHQDCGETFVNSIQSDADILVIAGDLVTFNSLWILKHLCKNYKRVVFVPGNHEYYGSGLKAVQEKLLIIQNDCPNLKILDPGTYLYPEVKFVGTTLWFKDTPRSIPYQMSFNDFCKIDRFQHWVFKRNKQAQEFLWSQVDQDSIVVTHHLPLLECTADKWKNDPLSDFFICDMRDLILAKKPKLWIYGHTHDSHDFVFGDTRFICNPFGYLKVEENRSFDWNKIVEV